MYNFSRSCLNAFHAANPLRLIFFFHQFCNAFTFCNLFNKQVEHLSCLRINLRKILPQLALSDESCKNNGLMISKIIFMQHSPFAELNVCFFGRQSEIRYKIVANLSEVSSFLFCIVSVLSFALFQQSDMDTEYYA